LFGKPPFASKSVRELEDRIYDTTPIEVISRPYIICIWSLIQLFWS